MSVVPANAGTHTAESIEEYKVAVAFRLTSAGGYGSLLSQGRQQPQLIVAPPSITSVWPVVKLPAFEAKNTAAPAISSGSPIRSSGERAVEAFKVSGLSHSAFAKSVLIRPGAMQLTRMLCFPYSQARLRASCMSAAFEIA